MKTCQAKNRTRCSFVLPTIAGFSAAPRFRNWWIQNAIRVRKITVFAILFAPVIFSASANAAEIDTAELEEFIESANPADVQALSIWMKKRKAERAHELRQRLASLSDAEILRISRVIEQSRTMTEEDRPDVSNTDRILHRMTTALNEEHVLATNRIHTKSEEEEEEEEEGTEESEAHLAPPPRAGLPETSTIPMATVEDIAREQVNTKVDELASKAQDPFGRLGFGVALSLTHDLGSHSRVEEAQLANGIVRLKDEGNDLARVMLETHYFFDAGSLWRKKFGLGPFVAVQPGSEDIIDAVGFGGMIGFKRDSELLGQSSFNLGIGGVVDPDSTVLADGIRENQPLPAGETEIRFKEKSQWGLLFLTSYSWF